MRDWATFSVLIQRKLRQAFKHANYCANMALILISGETTRIIDMLIRKFVRFWPALDSTFLVSKATIKLIRQTALLNVTYLVFNASTF